jgi:hypothetical protein
MDDSSQTNVFACQFQIFIPTLGIQVRALSRKNGSKFKVLSFLIAAWSVSTILTGLLSIMLENSPLLGSCESTLYEKKKLAMNSLEFNVKNEVFR